MSKQRVNIMLTGPQLEALRSLSSETGLSVSDLVRRAVDRYLQGNGPTATTRKSERDEAEEPPEGSRDDGTAEPESQ